MRAVRAATHCLLALVITSAARAEQNTHSDASCLIERPSHYSQSAQQIDNETAGGRQNVPDSSLRIPRPSNSTYAALINDAPAVMPDDRQIFQPRPISYETSVAARPADEVPVTKTFWRWLRHFGNPVICNMIFCNSSCADYDDSCPSFHTAIIQSSDETFSACQPDAAAPAQTQPESQASSRNDKSKSCCQ